MAQIAAPQSVDARVAEGVAETRIAQEELAKADRPLWWWVDPLAWRLEAHSDAQASVAEWTTTVLTAHGVAVPQSALMDDRHGGPRMGRGQLAGRRDRDRPARPRS